MIMTFSMEVPDLAAVKTEVMEQVKPQSEEQTALAVQAKRNVDAIMQLNLDSLEERRGMLQSVEQFGAENMQRSEQKSSLLQVSVGKLAQAGDEGGLVSKSLMDLHHEIKDLDPGLIDFAKTGILAKIFNPVRSYFERYQKADSVINDILVSLDKGRSSLKNDNTTLELEEQSLRELTNKLNQEVALGAAMDSHIEQQLEQAKLKEDDGERVRFLSEEILFPLRQRLMDMQQMIAVNQQGIMAIEVIRRNNKELIRGVDRAKTVTVSALRIAVIVASALYNQKIVLKKIQALNETTNELISGTSRMLKDQGAAIQQQAMEASVSVETLQGAYNDVIAALEAISKYKREALPKMKLTVEQFRDLASKGEKEIERLEKGNATGL